MSSPNTLALHAAHSHQGSRGGCPDGGLGISVSTRRSPCLGQRSTGVLHVVLRATTQPGRGAGAVSPMAYSTPAWSLMFSNFVETSQRNLVSSLSQSQSTLAAKRKGDSRPQKGNTAKKKRGKLDTDNGTGYKAAEKRSAKTDTKDDTKDDDKEDVFSIGGVLFGMKQQEERHLAEFNTATGVAERRGKIDIKDEAEYDDEEDVLPVTDAPFGVK
jgi:hypothetical protein